jgi:hypothetical protein
MKGREIRVQRDPHGRPPFEHPMRDFAGIQYYFHNQVRLGKGHIYFPRAEWGLSSISQLAYWRERMSPAGPFMGQLSVDIGNFYMTAPARLGNRTGRSTWNSTREDIAAEVWFQVRQGLDRERAGELVSPGFYHIDQGLQFDHPLGSTFRNEVRITVMDAAGWHTLWINGQRFAYEGRAQAVAETLCRQINESGSGALYAEATLKAPGIWQMHVTSKVPEGAALVIVEGDLPGRFEISLNASTFRCVESPSSLAQTRGVRDKLFEALVGDPSLPVISELSGKTGILLLPRGAAELPPIRVRNDHQQLQIVYGPTLHVRIEQCHGGLAFEAPASATVGYNDTPFLINVPGQWRYRPGLFMPAQLTFQDTVLRPEEDERIRYRISNRRWVAAGTYMATTTQLTTMESANESARHAVNAILRCLAFGSGSDYNAQGQVYADLAEIWDPEKNELDDLEPLKRLDAKLVAEGLPHVMDILKIVDQVDSMPMHGKPSRDPAANALHLLQHLADGSDRDWSFLKQTLGDLASQAVERVHDVGDPLGVLRELRHDGQGAIERIRQLLQTVMGRPGGGAGDGRRSPT